MEEEELKQLLGRYKEKLSSELRDTKEERKADDFVRPDEQKTVSSREYKEFKKQFLPRNYSFYEKYCRFSEKLFSIRLDPKRKQQLQEALDICHLEITPESTQSAAFVTIIIFLLFAVLGVSIPLLMGFAAPLFLPIMLAALGAAFYKPVSDYPYFLANSWRMKASNQMVICIFYIITYMRHTSNLELAIDFAAEHLAPPLSIDLKKVLWDVESEKYPTINESMDHYLESWKKWNQEFVDAFQQVEGSLLETSEERRVAALDKALQIILDGTFERMLHYAHNLKNPLTMLNMMGIILPILGLVVLPLVVNFMEGVKWYYIAMIYNVFLPLIVWYFTKQILATRPTGYGDTDIAEINPELANYQNLIFNVGGMQLKISPAFLSILFMTVFLLIGLSPIILHSVNCNFDIVIGEELDQPSLFYIGGEASTQCTQPPELSETQRGHYYFLGYRQAQNGSGIIGPFGIGAALISIAVILAVGVGAGIYYKYRSKNVLKIREETKKLEKEFAGGLFQLGNRLGDGLPAELAFAKVAEIMKGSTTGDFFNHVSSNITKMGMSVEAAIFDPKVGAILYYPSSMIESSMKVLVESAKKGPRIASQTLVNISTYIKEIHRVDERLKDMLADIISSLKSQISFLTPIISAIVVGITSMITGILGVLSGQMKNIQASVAGEGVGGVAPTALPALFGDGLPTYYLQIIIGLYVVEIIFCLTILLNGIENGSDSLGERYLKGQNLIKTTLLYTTLSLVLILLFNIIAASITQSGLLGA